MNKAIIGVVAVGVIGAGVGVGLPYYGGMLTKATYMKQIEEINASSSTKVKALDYQQGIFESSARTEITIVTADGPVSFSLDHQIKHGPTFSNPHAATIITMPQLPEDLVSGLKLDKDALALTTHVGFSGASSTKISSAAFTKEKDNTKFEWGGIDGTINTSADAGKVELNVTMGGLNVTEPDENVSIRPVTLTSSMTKQDNGLWSGNGKIQAEAVTGTLPGMGNFEMKNLVITTEQTSTGEVANGAMTFDIDHVTFGPYNVDKIGYAVALRNMDAPALVRLNQAMAESGGNPDEVMGVYMMKLMGELPNFMGRKPELEMSRLHFKSDFGNLDGNMLVKYTGEAVNPMQDPAAVVAALDANAELTMSKQLLRQILLSSTQKRLMQQLAMGGGDSMPDPAEINAMAAQSVDQQLGLFTMQNWLVEDEENYSTKVSFNKGALTINGQPADELMSVMGQ